MMDGSAEESTLPVSSESSAVNEELTPHEAVAAVNMLAQVVSIPDNRDDMNGHSSPDSGVNDMSDERPIGIAAGEPLPPGQKVEHKVTVLPNQTMKIHMNDTTRYIKGPANITMVSNSCHHAGPIPIRAGGQALHPTVDKNVMHYILTHPPAPPSNHNSMGQATGGQMPPHSYHYHPPHGIHPTNQHRPYSYNGAPGPQQQQYPHQYHHHIVHPALLNGNGGPANAAMSHRHKMADDRSTRISRSDRSGRIKGSGENSVHLLSQVPVCTAANIQHLTSPRYMNGIRQGSDVMHDSNSCSNSTDSLEEDDKRQLRECLSAIPLPQVEAESHQAVTRITPPDIPASVLAAAAETSANQELQYQLFMKENKEGQLYLELYNGPATSITTRDLKPFTDYYVKVCAILDDVRGAETDPLTFKTLPAAPSIPKSLKATTRTKSNILLRWSAPDSNGSPITNYVLEYYKDASNNNHTVFEVCYSGPKKEYKVTKLHPSQTYVFRLSAHNEVGRSEYGPELRVETLGTVPGQPEPPTLVEATESSLSLKWTKRSCDHDFTLQHEEEKSEHGFLATYSGPDTHYCLNNLSRSSSYKFRIAASNENGQSSWSHVMKCKTKSAIPHSPLKLATKGKVTSSSFRICWEAPTDDGGSVVTSYVAQLDDGSGYVPVYEGSSCECSCVSLLPGHTYTSRVAARNEVGQSHWSDSIPVITKPVCPGVCGKPWVHGKPKAHSLHIKWVPPEKNGGAQVKQYVVQLIYMNNTTKEVYRGPDTDCQVNELSPGRSYLIQVRAVNLAGEGEWSDTVEVVSGAGNPEPPTAPSCAVKSAHNVIVSWVTPCNNGAKISEYRLEWKPPGHEDFSQIHSSSALSHEVTSLQPNTEYSFRVIAVNSSGASVPSDESTILTLPSSPAAVNGVTTTPSALSISVSWSKPEEHGSQISHYNVEYGKQQAHTIDAELTECLLENLTPDTVYRIRVQAVNGVGAGAFSSSVKVTTLLLPPEPPVLECVGHTYNAIRLKWSEPINSQQYTVWKSQADSQPQNIYTGSALQFKVTKLHENTAYNFSVSAWNSAGEGAPSSPLAITTSRAPPHSVKAPVISDKYETECRVSWASVKPLPGDCMEYRLQLSENSANASSSSSDYRQVYQGSDTCYQLSDLKSGTCYSVRVCPVRICSGDSKETVLGAFSPSTTFKTNVPQPVEHVKASPAQSTPPVWRQWLHRFLAAVRPEPEKRMLFMMLGIGFLISILLSWIAFYCVT